MGLEDFIDKAKDFITGADDKVEAEAGQAADQAAGAAADAQDAAQGAAQDAGGGLMDKAKEFLSDANIENLAEKVKGFTPDSVDGLVDKAADKAEELNDRFES